MARKSGFRLRSCLRDLHFRVISEAEGCRRSPRGVRPVPRRHAGAAGARFERLSPRGDHAVLRHRHARTSPALERRRPRRGRLPRPRHQRPAPGREARSRRHFRLPGHARDLAHDPRRWLARPSRAGHALRGRVAPAVAGRTACREGAFALEPVRSHRDDHLVIRGEDRVAGRADHDRYGDRQDATACARRPHEARADRRLGGAAHRRPRSPAATTSPGKRRPCDSTRTHSRGLRGHACTGPATWRESGQTGPSNASVASIIRSRSEDSGSSLARSRAP